PRLLEGHPVAVLACADGSQPGAGEVLVRSWIEGEPLHRATELPRDFFDLLDDLCFTLHRAGICHNDLHKEQNLVVQPDGRPALIDFQLASVHARQGRGFRTRASEDLRHLQKHRRRYTRDGRGPFEASEGAGFGRRRGLVARTWRRFGKPVYRFVTRRVLRTSDAEERRPSSGPWPTWTDPLGPT
ncbi:MAG: phosphotransferase, partial [Planctomycetota bacterium]|nr:phosphotransferase [Planctomycetota bacterium]